ncbi:RNA 2',3'-cyclic phosphodiesterase [Roseibacterium beibuensis]|uniref:RNA 2',3'-cyclic phosphodiesterase n=2 Tax=[Roseibacterium] beibuensis TaxID=1193142 RepID=A0ABP9LDZ8_9RHOB
MKGRVAQKHPAPFPMVMRAFIVLPIPEETTAALARLQSALPVGKAVPEQNLHLTLAFLGEVSEATLEEIDMGLSGLHWPAVEIVFDGLDSFTEMERGLVFAAVRHTQALDGLQAKVAAVARAAGVDLPRRRFRPHVTLMRSNRRPRGPARDRLAAQLGARAAIPGFVARDIVLFGSTLTPAGAIHEALASYPLMEPPA